MSDYKLVVHQTSFVWIGLGEGLAWIDPVLSGGGDGLDWIRFGLGERVGLDWPSLVWISLGEGSAWISPLQSGSAWGRGWPGLAWFGLDRPGGGVGLDWYGGGVGLDLPSSVWIGLGEGSAWIGPVRSGSAL